MALQVIKPIRNMSKLHQRYNRNALFSKEEQARLAQAHVLIVGLGGLGGYVLDMLARTGVGHIVGADGDTFEASNLNRQLLCTEARLGQSKALAAAEHVHAINSSITFTPIPQFLRGEALDEAVQDVDIVIDALGGLQDRLILQNAAAKAQKILVSAGIAGYTGWMAIVEPGKASPYSYMGNGESVETQVGNLAPTAATAASMQVVATLEILLNRMDKKDMNTMILFDLAQAYHTKLEL